MPEFRTARIELLDEGYDFQVFEDDGGWLFRFPKRESGIAKLNKEHQLLSGVGAWVSLPVPNYEYCRRSFEYSSRPFGVYQKIPGDAGDTSEVIDRQKVARQLGVFLERLHSYPLEKAIEAGMPERADLVMYWRDKSREQLKRLTDLKVNKKSLLSYIEGDTPTPFKGTVSLVHNDLWAEHILISTRSGEVSGIIDWGDALIGDPAIDFACLYAWYGMSWLEDVLVHYNRELDPEFISRSRYLATCLAIHNITLGQELNRIEWIEAGYAALQLVFTP